jgi:hypothetical protein
MEIEIFEIDFGTDGDLYMVTKLGNQITIPNGENLFEKWSDRIGLTDVEHEREFEHGGESSTSTSRTYDKSRDLMIEFAMAVKHLWTFARDRDGELYGPESELN